MKNRHPLVWLIPLIVLLMLVPFIVPSALPYAGAEAVDLPAYAPVELEKLEPGTLPMPSPRGADPNAYKPHEDGFVMDDETGVPWEYRDETIYVKIETRTIERTKVCFTWVQISDPNQLRTHCTGTESNPMTEAKKAGALLAITGDSYSLHKDGIIYRNTELMRPERSFNHSDALLIDTEGRFHIFRRPADDAFAPYVGNILHSFLFGPALVIDGELQNFEDTRYGLNVGMLKLTQRQALCEMGPLSYLILTTEGPNESRGGGFTIPQLAKLAYDMGAKNAYNLDGGNTVALILNGVKMNRFGKGGYRPITDLIYFVTAKPAPVVTEAPSEEPSEVPSETPEAPAETELPAAETEGSAAP